MTMGNEKQIGGLLLSATGFGLPAGVPLFAMGTKEALEPPDIPKPKEPGIIDEEATLARKRERDRALNLGRRGNKFAPLGASPSTSGISVVRTALTSGSGPGTGGGASLG